MSKYIEANWLLERAVPHGWSTPLWVSDIVINDAPAADVVEVVRCKDCRFYEAEQPGMVYCPAVVGGWVEIDWFCKGGEKREDAEVH